MQVGLIIPADTPPTGGNSISARRLQTGLQNQAISSAVELYHGHLGPFDVYHGWNAHRVGVALVEAGIDPRRIVVTWTGTDLWQDWVKDYRPIAKALEPVAAQVVFTEDARDRILQDMPGWRDRIHVIPPSVDEAVFRPEPPSKEFPHPFLLLAGGVRPVKRSAWAVELVEATRAATGLDIHLAVAGPARHIGEWEMVRAYAKTRPWVHLLGEVPKEDMVAWYNSADVTLNTSAVEGVSNALMEALACGSLVLCSNIAGNRYLVQDGINGLLFENQDEFVAKLSHALQPGDRMTTLRTTARDCILARHSLMREAQDYVELYQQLLAVAAGPHGCHR